VVGLVGGGGGGRVGEGEALPLILTFTDIF
jgi:hypothetical protein